MDFFKLPDNASETQIEIFNNNCKLYKKACENRNKFGVLMSLCTGLGSQDLVLSYDADRFISVYPYDLFWYQLSIK
jgi:hypothetical protein